jgi:ribosomal protein L7/L12
MVKTQALEPRMNNDIFLVLVVFALAIVLSQLASIQTRLRENEARLNALLKHLGVDWGAFAEPSDRVKALARDPKTKIQAIKAYREQTGLGLKEAKDVIEKLATAESH